MYSYLIFSTITDNQIETQYTINDLNPGINTLTEGVSISFFDGILILFLASIAGLFVKYTFTKYSNSFSSKSSFGNTIFLLTISVAALIAVVKSSLALSLGLVGALSVVRFRTAVKEPYNLAFLLFSICLGISIGASQFYFAILIAIFGFIAVYITFRNFKIDKTNNINSENVDTLCLSLKSEENLQNLYQILNNSSYSYVIKTLTINAEKDIFISIGINLRNYQSMNNLINELKSQMDFIEITFYNSPTN